MPMLAVMDSLAHKIRRHLTPDLLKPEYRGASHPYAGHCYVASEAYWHLTGKRYKPMVIRHEGGTHWFLRDGDRVIDLTAEQFSTPIPYDAARGCGFLTREPSKRARELMRRIT